MIIKRIIPQALENMNFDKLLDKIEQLHRGFQQQAVKDVNIKLTLRNWLIGYYIVEFEQKGDERAQYGENLLVNLSKKLKIRGLAETNLKLCRQFYNFYPQIMEILSHHPENWLPENIRLSLSDVLPSSENKNITIRQLSTDDLNTKPYKSKQNGGVKYEPTATSVYYNKLIQLTSFTHFVELLKIPDDTKRKFYELLILRTTPTVSELKRQINAQTFEKVGLSEKTDTAFTDLQHKIEPQHTIDVIKSIHFFDFLELISPESVEEKDKEIPLLHRLEEFILDSGQGFCFESRQQRILIDTEYYVVDLVFYHRILKCHILVELKMDTYTPDYLVQLNKCVGHFSEEIKEQEDKQPIGILLCAQEGKRVVEYALNGMLEKHFESNYLGKLPSKEQLITFIKEK